MTENERALTLGLVMKQGLMGKGTLKQGPKVREGASPGRSVARNFLAREVPRARKGSAAGGTGRRAVGWGRREEWCKGRRERQAF